jgi:hypothetical protein
VPFSHGVFGLGLGLLKLDLQRLGLGDVRKKDRYAVNPTLYVRQGMIRNLNNRMSRGMTCFFNENQDIFDTG